eukprot:TRINITY_DN9879_c0_g1_i10.p1 TRINITY_DN9879_c0_g1~~TRINITY_DN9879_c0_g1_i10.p1  ORF type:complete len:437 (+),score=81.97 TRINITY_DN9879_c0_g1_i10:320-1630(+)
MFQIASDENSELRAALQCLSSDESLALLDDTSEQTLAFKLKVQLVDILPQPDHQIQRTPVLLAVLFEVTALVLCMAALGEGKDFGVLNGTYLYFQIASSIGAGPVQPNQGRGYAVLAVFLASAASLLILSALSIALMKQRAIAFSKVLVGQDPQSAWVSWESGALLARLPLFGALGVTVLSLVVLLSADEQSTAPETLMFIVMSLSTVGLGGSPTSDGAKAWGIVLCVCVWAIVLGTLAVLLDRAVRSFVLMTLQVATGRIRCPVDGKVVPVSEPTGMPLQLPQPPNTPRAQPPELYTTSLGTTSEPPSEHKLAFVPQEKPRSLPVLKEEPSKLSRELGRQQKDDSQASPDPDRRVAVHEVFWKFAGGETLPNGQLKRVCAELGIMYGASKHEALVQLLDSKKEGVVSFERFYTWLLRRDQTKQRLREERASKRTA